MPRIASENARSLVGFEEFRRELKELGQGLEKELGKANQQAGRVITSEAQAEAAAHGGVEAKSAQAVKASRSQAAVMVVLDAQRFPWAFGAEFGAVHYPQFDPWTGSGPDAGHFFFPAMRAKQDEVVQVYDDLLAALTARAFPL